MLSEETATGRHPFESVRFMARILEAAEKDFHHERYLGRKPREEVSESVAHAACVLADHLNASAIVAPTSSGMTAAQVSRFRPRQPVIALSPHISAVRKAMLYWGCEPVHTDSFEAEKDLFEATVAEVLGHGLVQKGDLLVITAGFPFWVRGTTNMIRVRHA
jgi:pyruvate kinase